MRCRRFHVEHAPVLRVVRSRFTGFDYRLLSSLDERARSTTDFANIEHSDTLDAMKPLEGSEISRLGDLPFAEND